MCEESKREVEDVVFVRGGLQDRLDATVLHLLHARNLVMVARERLGKHRGRLNASHLRLELLLSPLSSHFGDGIDRLSNDEVTVHIARLSSVVTLAWTDCNQTCSLL